MVTGDNLSQLRNAVLLRYHRDGHVRFELPELLCTKNLAELLERQLIKREGLYRVTLYRRYRKLSIRYLDTVCDLQDVALYLDDALAEIHQQLQQGKAQSEETQQTKGLKDRLLDLPFVQRAKEKYQHARATARVLSVVVRERLGKPSGPPLSTERLAINFLNDMVSFYLIKLHWKRITQEWLRQPWAYRYQWLTVFYLVFLLVRYRKSGVKP